MTCSFVAGSWESPDGAGQRRRRIVAAIEECHGLAVKRRSQGRWCFLSTLSAPIATAESEVSTDDILTFRPYVFGMQGTEPSISEVAALVGNPARANVLMALLDGRALTASELAHAAGVSPQTTSGHLARMTEARLLTLTKQGRHSYYRLASPLVCRMLEGIMAVA